MRIVIDNRESGKRIGHACDVFDGALIDNSVETIDVGDYLLYNDNDEVIGAIEYKTYGDFVSSILNGHLESQLVDMDNYTYPYLFVVGTYGAWKKATRNAIRLNKRSIEGFKVKVLCAHKTKLIQFDSESEALDAMTMILNRSKSLDGDIKLPERKKSTGDPQLDMYLSVPAIGKVKAQLYASKMSFYEFLTVCKSDDAKELFKNTYEIPVQKAVISYCRGL